MAADSDRCSATIAVDMFDGKVHVEWNPTTAAEFLAADFADVGGHLDLKDLRILCCPEITVGQAAVDATFFVLGQIPDFFPDG